MQGVQEGGHAGKGRPAVGTACEQAPHHHDLVGNAGMHDRVVDVADHHEAARASRDEHIALGVDRDRSLQPKSDPMPEPVCRRRFGQIQFQAKIAVAVGADGFFHLPEACREFGIRNAPGTHQPPEDFELMPDTRTFRRCSPRFAEDSTHQEEATFRTIAAIGLDHQIAAPGRARGRPDNRTEHIAEPLPARFQETQGQAALPRRSRSVSAGMLPEFRVHDHHHHPTDGRLHDAVSRGEGSTRLSAAGFSEDVGNNDKQTEAAARSTTLNAPRSTANVSRNRHGAGEKVERQHQRHPQIPAFGN